MFANENASVLLSDRVFAYTTPPLQPTPSNLIGTPLLLATAFHLLAAPEVLGEYTAQLAALRSPSLPPSSSDHDHDHDQSSVSPPALFVWEPAPFSCNRANLAGHLQAAKLVDVYSPNHEEFLSTFYEDTERQGLGFDRAAIEKQASRVLESGVGTYKTGTGEGVVIIRCAKHGSLVMSRSFPCQWFPAFHHGDSSRVVDATGAGNAFLGGFAVTFTETGGGILLRRPSPAWSRRASL